MVWLDAVLACGVAVPCRCVSASAIEIQRSHQCCTDGGAARQHEQPAGAPDARHQPCPHCPTLIAAPAEQPAAAGAPSQSMAPATLVDRAALYAPISGAVGRSHHPPRFVNPRLFTTLCTLVL
jgi:hypothetical protein